MTGAVWGFLVDPPAWFSAALAGFCVASVAVAFWVSRVGWLAFWRTRAELSRVYAHRLVVTEGGQLPDREGAPLYVEVWQAVTIATYSGTADVHPVAEGDISVWFLPPAPGAAGRPRAGPDPTTGLWHRWGIPTPRGGPPAD